MITVLAAIVLVIGLCGAIRMPIGIMGLYPTATYGILNYLGQAFALPLTLLSGAFLVLSIIGADAFWVSLLAFLICGYNLLIGLLGGKAALLAVGAGDQYEAVRGRALSASMLPFKTGQAGVEKLTDIAYGDLGYRNLLDLYRPQNAPESGMPILIHVHGGAWVIGQKDQQAQPLIQTMAKQGWLVADINYRLGPKNKFPAMIEDVLKAIHWIKEHAAEYGGDPSFVAITGGSAGGHLTALATLAHDNPAFKPGFEEADCSVQASVPIYGKFDFLDSFTLHEGAGPLFQDFLAERVLPPVDEDPDLWRSVSPMQNVRSDAPPMLIFQGEHDVLIPFREAQEFASAMKRVAQNPVVHVQLPGAQHAYDIWNAPVTVFHVAAISQFLSDVRGGTLPRHL